MNRIDLSYNEINPFIRFADYVRFPNQFTGDRKAYDSKLMYIVKGNTSIKIDGISYNASKGSLFIWNPGIAYEVDQKELQEFIIISLNFDYTRNHIDILKPFDPCEESSFNPAAVHEICSFTDAPFFNSPVYLQNMQDEVEDILNKIVNEHRFKTDNYIMKSRILFLTLIDKVAELARTDNYLNRKNDKVGKVISYISKYYHLPIDYKTISKDLNYHPVYLNRLMVAHTGYSIHRYLLNQRIRHAVYLLHTTNRNISEIAFNVGFNDVNTFSLCFKKIIGMSPKTYLKANSEKGF